MSDTAMTVGDRIRATRKREGISQTELAQKMGVIKQTLYKYETGIVTNIPSEKIEAAAKALGVTPGFLMGWTPTAFPMSATAPSTTCLTSCLPLRSRWSKRSSARSSCTVPKSKTPQETPGYAEYPGVFLCLRIIKRRTYSESQFTYLSAGFGVWTVFRISPRISSGARFLIFARGVRMMRCPQTSA